MEPPYLDFYYSINRLLLKESNGLHKMSYWFHRNLLFIEKKPKGLWLHSEPPPSRQPRSDLDIIILMRLPWYKTCYNIRNK
jgi:hypothetical protein